METTFGWVLIQHFAGTFDGNNYTINNLWNTDTSVNVSKIIRRGL